MLLETRPRSEALAPFVTSLGYFEGELPLGRERVLPSGHVSLMVNLFEDEFRTYGGPGHARMHTTRGAAFTGPQSRHTVIDTQEQRRVLGVSFRLGGAAPFFEIPLDETCDELVDLEELWGSDGRVLRERVLEAKSTEAALDVIESTLLDRLKPSSGPDQSIDFAVRALERGMAVSQVTLRLDVLPKRFVRRFRRHVGLTPKRFARVRRLQRVLGAAARKLNVDWAEAAVEHGYYDQAHLIHDFRELTEITPTAYRPRAAYEWNHVPLE